MIAVNTPKKGIEDKIKFHKNAQSRNKIKQGSRRNGRGISENNSSRNVNILLA